MDPADPREDRAGVLLGPGRRGVGPLGGPGEVAQILAGADEAAVHLAGRVGAEPTFEREQHGVVEAREPRLGLAVVDEQPSQGLQRFRLEVG